MGIGSQMRADVMSELRRQYLYITLALVLIITQTSAQNVLSASSSSSFDSSSSKGGGLGGSRFRENIISVQRAQQQAPNRAVSQQQVSEIQAQQIQQQITDQRQSSFQSSSFESQQTVDAEPAIYGSVRGTPGVDFPAYTTIPNTKFSCDGLPFETGMYADEFTGCQVYHLCYQGRRESFLCGIGTVFNQAIMSCDFWHAVDCAKSSLYYSLNSEFGKASSEPGSSVGLQQRRVSLSNQILQRKEAIFRPQTSQRTESFVSNVQQQVAALPQQLNTASFQETSFSSSNGKVSPPRQETTQLQQSSNSQRSGSQLVSPGRRVASYNEQRNQFMSESAPSRAVTSQETSAEQHQVSSNLVVTNSAESAPALDSSAKTSARKPLKEPLPKIDSAGKTNLLESQRQQSSDEQLWKPVFRNKGGVKTSIPSSAQQPESGANSEPVAQTTAASSEPPASSREPASVPPTVAQPEIEPTFSSDSSPAPPTNSSLVNETPELPSVPKSSPPPETPPTTTTTTTTTTAAPEATSERASVESDDGLSVGSTRAEESASSSQPSPEEPSPSTTSDQAPQTTSATTPPATQPAPTGTSQQVTTTTEQQTSTTEQSTSGADQLTTTTGSPHVSAATTTTSEPAETQPTSERPASSDSGAESKKRRKKRKKKKKRRVNDAQSSAEPKLDTSQSAPRLNASSVEYVAG